MLSVHGENDDYPSIIDIIHAEEYIEHHFSSNGWPHCSDDELYNDDIDRELETIQLEVCAVDKPDLPPTDDGWDDHDIQANNEYSDALALAAGVEFVVSEIRRLAQTNRLEAEYAGLAERFLDGEL
jgi:hypothetical protein